MQAMSDTERESPHVKEDKIVTSRSKMDGREQTDVLTLERLTEESQQTDRQTVRNNINNRPQLL